MPRPACARGPTARKNARGPGADCPEKYLPDFVKVAQANGVEGLRAEKPDEVEPVLRRGLESPGPVLMEFMVSKLENVYPDGPLGKADHRVHHAGA